MENLEVEVDLSDNASYQAYINSVDEDGIVVYFKDHLKPEQHVKFENVRLPQKYPPQQMDFKQGDIIQVLSKVGEVGLEAWWKAKVEIVKDDLFYVEYMDREGNDLVTKDKIQPFFKKESFKRLSVRVPQHLQEICEDDEVHAEFIKHSGVLTVVYSHSQSSLIFISASDTVHKKASLLADMHIKTLQQKLQLKQVKEKTKYTETFVVSSDLVGLVIGTKGCNIKKANKIEGVTSVNKVKQDEGFRFRITGEKEQAVKEARSILEICQESFIVPHQFAGLIIGKNGQNMENILNGSLVNRIILENETDGVNLKIIGSPKAIENAKFMLNFRLNELKETSKLSSRNLTKVERESTISMETEAIRNQNQRNHVDTFVVSSDVMGFVIGKKGANINKARHIDGISFIEQKECEEGYSFTVIGESEEAVKKARCMLELCQEIIEIPQQFAGRIIGKSGQNIEEITKSSSVNKIIVQNTADVAVLKIIGNPESVENAKVMLNYKLDELMGLHRSEPENSDESSGDNLTLNIEDLKSTSQHYRGRGRQTGGRIRGGRGSRYRGGNRGRNMRQNSGSYKGVSDNEDDDDGIVFSHEQTYFPNGKQHSNTEQNKTQGNNSSERKPRSAPKFRRGRIKPARGERIELTKRERFEDQMEMLQLVEDDFSHSRQKTPVLTNPEILLTNHQSHQSGISEAKIINSGVNQTSKQRSKVKSQDNNSAIDNNDVGTESMVQSDDQTGTRTRRLRGRGKRRGTLDQQIQQETYKKSEIYDTENLVFETESKTVAKSHCNKQTKSREEDVSESLAKFNALLLDSPNSKSDSEDQLEKQIQEDTLNEMEVLKYLVQTFGGGCSFGTFICSASNLFSGTTMEEWFNMRGRKFHIYRVGSDIVYIAPYYKELCICEHYTGPSGHRTDCEKTVCSHFHICKQFVNGKCRNSLCPFPHDFTSAHNVLLKAKYRIEGFNDSDVIVMLRWKCPPLCHDYIYKKDGCREINDFMHNGILKIQSYLQECPFLHLCKDFYTGSCSQGNSCKKSHSFTDSHNSWVLRSCHLAKETEYTLREMIFVPPNKDKKPRTRKKLPKDDIEPSEEFSEEWAFGYKRSDNSCADFTFDPLKPSSYNRTPDSSTNTNNSQEGKPPTVHSPQVNSVIQITSNNSSKKLPVDSEDDDEPDPVLLEDAGSKYICLALTKTECSKPNCQDLHTNEGVPYLWQIKIDCEWMSFLPTNNFQIENAYCSLMEKVLVQDIVYNSCVCTVEVKFQKQEKDMYGILRNNGFKVAKADVRRLSTPSFGGKPLSVDSYLTQWRWYWKDDNGIWMAYDSDLQIYTLEVKFLKQQKTYLFSRENYKQKYRLCFSKMDQINLEYGTKREIVRRPLFVSENDLIGKIYPKKIFSSAIEVFGEHSKPAHFHPWDLANEFELVEIDSSLSTEYQDVLNSFYRTMKQSKYDVKFIYRVQSRKLWSEFETKKRHMHADAEKDNPMAGTIDERSLFHGTDSFDTCRGICINSFDFRTSGKNATAYGHGSYFARDASYSHSYTKASHTGDRYMFRAKVLVGNFTMGSSSYRRPPEIPGQSHKLYDSCVDHPVNPSIFVVFDRNQSYPEYLINYSEKENDERITNFRVTVSSAVHRTSSLLQQTSQPQYSSGSRTSSHIPGSSYSSSSTSQLASTSRTPQSPSAYSTSQHMSTSRTPQQSSAYSTLQQTSTYRTPKSSSAYSTSQQTSTYRTPQQSSANSTSQPALQYRTLQSASAYSASQPASTYRTPQSSFSFGSSQTRSTYNISSSTSTQSRTPYRASDFMSSDRQSAGAYGSSSTSKERECCIL